MRPVIYLRGILILTVLLFFGQQCSKVTLEENKQFSFSQMSNNPYYLPPPTLFPIIRRFIVFMDMSHSMVSGLCIQDVDANKNYSSNYFTVYDPNKNVGSVTDHRASGVDCKVDASRPFDSLLDSKPIDLGRKPDEPLLTHPGVDYTKDRLVVLKNWIEILRNDIMKPGDSTQFMIVPFSGGIAQTTIDAKVKSFLGAKGAFQFFDIKSDQLDHLIQWMTEEQDFNYSLATSEESWRYEKTTMGTSSPGALYKSLYDVLQKDMRELNTEGVLFHTTYQWIHVTDGFITPIKDHIKYVLESYQPCASCAQDPKRCTGTCGTLAQKMRTAWGDPINQDPQQMDFYFGLMESLPSYYGTGILRSDFVNVQPKRIQLSRPGDKPFWETLTPFFKQRGTKPAVWSLEDSRSDLKLATTNNGRVNFKATHLYIFSPNARVNAQGQIEVDSDGDGLSDRNELLLGTKPDDPRSNGYCLDSFLGTPAFAERCAAMAQSKSCDKNLDSDGDSLNDCEENLLGSNVSDFDTDGDSFPDFFEWMYGYNPLKNDAETDSLGDGILNSTKFSAGLAPNAVLNEILPSFLTKFAINEAGHKKITDAFGIEHWVDLRQIILVNLPVSPGVVSKQNQKPLSVARISVADLSENPNVIPIGDQLISPISRSGTNSILALARVIDIDEPSNIYWQIYKADVPVPIELVQPQLDLSQFKLFRTRDQGGYGAQ